MTESPRKISDRQVFLLMALVVVAVLALNFLSSIVPGMDQLLAVAPVLLVVLVLGTAFVLYRSLRPR